MDANFNRAREAARVAEEYCRFVLKSRSLSARVKQLRHQLCAAIGNLDNNLLMASRDSEMDVGRGLQVQGQMKRTDMDDCAHAAFKRLTEALRVLAEVGHSVDSSLSAKAEQLRFQAYTLEKDTFALGNASGRFKSVRLYVLVNAEGSDSADAILGLVRSCAEGGADCVQLRAKGVNDKMLLKLSRQFVSVCRDSGILSIINDRVDIAVLAGADGVHLGQDDLEPISAHQLEQQPLIIGISTHNPKELETAIESNCHYVSLGPVFASRTKPDISVAGLEYVEQAVPFLGQTHIRHVAIGGIDIENVAQVLGAGAQSVAVCSAVKDADSPKAVCEKLKKAVLESLNKT